jgi:septal ring factor EnvC (AmiA/AmiB activator)
MKLRIDKLPKTDEDLQEIQREIESQHHHNEEPNVEEIIGELYSGIQAMEGRINNIESDSKKCKEEISRIYKVLGKMLIALATTDQNEKIKNLKDILNLLE